MYNNTFKAVTAAYEGNNLVNYEMKKAFFEEYNNAILDGPDAYHKAQLIASAFSNCRSLKSAVKYSKALDELIENNSALIEDEEDEFDISDAITLAKEEFEGADPRAVMKEADIYTCCRSNKMIIKFNFCEFDFVIDIDYEKQYAEMTYALAGYESEFMFGVPTMNKGYNFLTGKIETQMRKMWPAELLAMVLKNMSRNGYIEAYIEEANLEDEFTELMNDDDAHNKLIMF